MRAKQILFFLASEKGYEVLKGIIKENKKEYIAGVVSFHEIGVQKDYFECIKNVCREEGMPFYEWKTIKDNLISIIKEKNVTSCIAVSWRYLLPLYVNKYLEDNLIIFHDSLLPKYRGFAPLVTAMICGDGEVGASVIFATEKADCGEIILQKAFNIDKSMRIHDVIKKMAKIYVELANDLIDGIIAGAIYSKPQNDDDATYSIWRDEEDYWIDWKWSADRILRCVNALGYPYKGAKTVIDGAIIRIVEAHVEKNDIKFAIRTPGKIWAIDNGCATVVCGSGLLTVKKAFDEKGNVYMFKKIRGRFVNKHNE